MEIKELIIKTIKQTLEMIIVIGIVTFHIGFDFKQSVWINLCTAMVILMSMAGLFVVLTHLHNKENNKANAISIGYAMIAILLILKFYYDQNKPLGLPLYNQHKVQFVLDFLEVIFIVVAIQWVGNMTSIKKYIISSIVILLVSIFISYRIDFLVLFGLNKTSSDMLIKFLRIILFFITLMGMYLCYYHYDRIDRINTYRLNFILILQCLYQMMYLFFYHLPYRDLFSILGIMKVLIYGNIYLFIYHDTLQNIWQRIDYDLKDKQKQLVDDDKQKGNTDLSIPKITIQCSSNTKVHSKINRKN